MTFGLLTVESLKERKDKRLFYNCVCNCGNKTVVRGAYLRNGLTKSCGCIRQELGKESIKKLIPIKTGEAAYNKLYRDYKYGAKARGYDFDITIIDFKNIIKQNCYYCNSEPNKIQKTYYSDEIIYYNGIDRMDNDLGYVLDNCLPCCTMCNQAKHNHSKDFFN